MSGLNPDIDRLLWEIAESNDPKACDEFVERFPQLKGELGKRLTMVRELRGARSPLGSGKTIPRFENRSVRRPAPSPQRGVWIGGGLILAAVAAASFSVTRFVLGRQVAPVVQVAPVKTDPAPAPDPGIKMRPGNDLPPVSKDPGVNNPPVPQNQDVPASAKPQTVKMERIRLLLALKAIAASGRLTLEFAPNMPNPEIRVDYHGMSAVDIMRDMGQRLGFTPIDQGADHWLVVPTRDPNARTEPPSAGSGDSNVLPDPRDKPSTDSGELPAGEVPSRVKKAPPTKGGRGLDF